MLSPFESRQSVLPWTAIVLGLCTTGCVPQPPAAPVRKVPHAETHDVDAKPFAAEKMTSPGLRERLTDGELSALRPHVEAFCGGCHAAPDPSSFPKGYWRKEVAQGFDFYWKSRRGDLPDLDMEDVVAFYETQAPEQFEFPTAAELPLPLSVQFRRQDIRVPAGRPLGGSVSSIHWQTPRDSAGGRLLFTDMRYGDVGTIHMASAWQPQTLATLRNPASVRVAELDGDGRDDWLVAELGDYPPSDHRWGEVVWLRADHNQVWKPRVLLDGIGRVADLASGDFDGDGGIDVLVAEFGFRKTGCIRLLVRAGDEAGVPRFTSTVVDARHGASFVRPTDWEGDGDLDFIALITQEHECVELFLNDGRGQFRSETLFNAQDPSYGSSGIELVDLDRDGDQDLLYTNGDMLDSMLAKPSHGVRWLENRGTFPFHERVLTLMPGAYKAVAADFDGDNDLDVAALALPIEGAAANAGTFDTLALLEQTEPGQFLRHRLRPPPEPGVALEAGDFDDDGDADLVCGSYGPRAKVWFSFWWNQGAD